MSKFNKNIQPTKTVNLAGGESYTESPKLALISLLLTSFVKDQYYRSAQGGMDDLISLIDQISDKKFVAKAAIYARTKFGMRSISHVTAAELASRIGGQIWAKNFYNRIIFRPDDMMEILAYIYNKNGKESNAIRKGFGKAFARFDEYQLAKYKKDGAEVSLIDVANIVHPQHTLAIEKLIKGALPIPKTWETTLTQAGQKAENEDQKEELKEEAWRDLLINRKIGYFALLRNLRNIIEQAPDLVPQAMELLTDESLIKKSLVLPFRYLTAIDEIQKLNGKGVREMLGALNVALDKATVNVPKFEGDTLIVLDRSGSMGGQPEDIGALFSAILMKSNNADFMMFDTSAKYITYNPADSTLTIAQGIKNFNGFGGGTDFHAIFQEANRAYDRIIILSDMQGWVGYSAPTASLAEYKRRLGANPRIYSFDLAGQGTLQFPESNVFAIAGFSEKIFDLIKLLEQDRNALVHEIEKVEL